MINLRLVNNICMDGYNNIHALLNEDDIKWLKEICPNGYLTVTTSIKNNVEYKPYYFTFPNDIKGKQLLLLLNLK